MVFIPLKDAQEAQFLKDNDAIVNERARTAANPSLNRPGVPGLLEAIQASQANNRNVNAILVQVQPGMDAKTAAESVAEQVRRWKHLEAFTREQMEEILVANLIATSARQIGMFLVILAIVSAAIVAFIIYTMTLGKIREIAVLGKSTLLKCLGAVIEPSGGRMVLGGETIYDDGWKIPDLRTLRRDSIGFVFQAPYLIPFLDVTDNVALLPMLAGRPNAEARQRARELLAALDVGHRALAQPSELSGGEQQRVSIARALANRPPVILADEPTAPLDSERALAVMRILNQMALQYHTAIIVVTHGEKIIPTFKRLYQIRDGSTHEETGEGRSL